MMIKFLMCCFILLAFQPFALPDTTQTNRTQKGILRIYLARHGQTDWNLQKRLQGFKDVPLNATGKKQAEELKQKLEGIPVDAIYSSALQRSRETAQIVAGNGVVISLPELNEQFLGKFEGAYLDGRDPKMEAEYDKRSADPNDTLDGGESNNQHYARVKAGLEKILKEHPQGTILIVGHGGTNVLIMRALLNLTAEQADGIHQANDELYLIELFPDRDPMMWKQVPMNNLDQL
jgi:2,3-bisphosphoglycerate-dependent phosphoglycerate mutase